MKERLPFYMVYQTPFLGDDEERTARRDYDYMKSIYPATAKRMMPFVEEECDRLMYDGSMIYDEYPDQLQLRLMCARIYDRAKDGEENPGKWLRDLHRSWSARSFARDVVSTGSIRKHSIWGNDSFYLAVDRGAPKRNLLDGSPVFFGGRIGEDVIK